MNFHIGTERIYEKLHLNRRTETVVKYLNDAGAKPRSRGSQ